jgi:putative addiction module component (TIGR02574 family)
MLPDLPGFDVGRLSVDQRLELIALLWDSIPDAAGAPPILDWHQQELDRRLAAADATPEAAVPWDQVKQRLRKKS